MENHPVEKSIPSKKTSIQQTIESFCEKHLQDMTNRHSKVLQVRFDIHYPTNGNIKYDSKQIRDFSEYMKRDLERNYPLPKDNRKRSSGKTGLDQHQVDPRMIWVKEQHNNSTHPHFHCLTLVNGNSKKTSYDIHKRAERQWKNVLGVKQIEGLVDYCDGEKPSSIMIDRNKKDYQNKLKEARQQASYLSKKHGKENLPSRTWKVGGSRIPRED